MQQQCTRLITETLPSLKRKEQLIFCKSASILIRIADQMNKNEASRDYQMPMSYIPKFIHAAQRLIDSVKRLDKLYSGQSKQLKDSQCE